MVDLQTGTYETIDFRQSRPRRPLYLFFVRHQQTVIGVGVSAILLISAYPYAPWLAVIAVVAYFGFRYLLVRRILHWPESGDTGTVRLLWRTLPFFAAATAFLVYLEWYTAYSTDMLPDTLWLLYLLVILVVCQYGAEWMVVTYVAASAIALLVIRMGGPNQIGAWTSPSAWSAWAVMSLWLALLALIFRIVSRHIGDLHSNFGLISEVQRELNRDNPLQNERAMLRLAVKRMSDSLRQDHVNIFRIEMDGSLRCMASAAARNAPALDEGYLLGAGQGILGKVVGSQGVYVANDVQCEKDYVRIDIYEKTAAEMGAPIFDMTPPVVGETAQPDRALIGVLDVQSNQRNAFLASDAHTVQILADLVGAAWTHCRLNDDSLVRVRAVDDALHSLVGEDASPQQIANVARVSLNASLVVLFARDKESGSCDVSALDGRVLFPTRFRSSGDHTLNLVQHILDGKEDEYFHERLEDLADDPFWRDERVRHEGAEPFVVREQIVARAVFRLRAGVQVLGVLFINYREPKRFSDAEKSLHRRVALMAAMALQSWQQQQQRLVAERSALARLLHDGPLNRASIIADLVNAVVNEVELNDSAREQLGIALRAAQEVKVDLRSVLGTWHGYPTTDLYLALTQAASDVSAAYRMAVELHMEVREVILPSQVVSELTLIVNEALLNAHNHGHARRVDILVAATDRELSVQIVDDGDGFDQKEQKRLGINNMKRRAEDCGGRCEITSELNHGTQVQVRVPLSVPIDA